MRSHLQRLLMVMTIIVTVFSFDYSFSDNYNFRKTRWGMSMQDVKTSEPLEPYDLKDGLLSYRTNILGNNVYLFYIFVNDKLVRAKYNLAEEHSNYNDFIQDYDNYKDIIKKKYGKPNKENVYWKSRIYRNDPSNYGMAVATGNLSYFSEWETSDTKITCFLYGDNFKVQCGVEYLSKELSSLEKEQREKKNLENF